MMNMLYTHHSNETGIFREAAELIAESLDADVPVILEALPFGIGRPNDYTLENIGYTVRAAAETRCRHREDRLPHRRERR
jgi:hypothetical protein